MAQRKHGQRPVEIQMDQMEVIALAHTVRELLLPVVENEIKLTFEQANSYFTTWHATRRLLGKVDTGCLNRPHHKAMADFFLGDGQYITKHFAPSDPRGLRVMQTFHVEANLRFGKDVVQVFNEQVRAENAFRSLQPVRDIARNYGLEVVLHEKEQEEGHGHAFGRLYIEMDGAMILRGDCKSMLICQEQEALPETREGGEAEAGSGADDVSERLAA